MDVNYQIGDDVKDGLNHAIATETSAIGKKILESIAQNAEIASQEKIPMCQDTGMCVFFVSVGQKLCIEGGSLTEAINEGVRMGYKEGFLRKSVVSDPFVRKNTMDNTPAIIHFDIIEGDELIIEMAAKGFGSENMSKLAMLKPSEGKAGVIDFVLKTVKEAGPNPCPPMIIGVGVGGTMEKAALLAKKALFRQLGEKSSLSEIAQLEKDLLEGVNALGIGPQGFGGLNTALGVHVETFPTHIAGLPVAVNINCHASRHLKVIL